MAVEYLHTKLLYIPESVKFWSVDHGLLQTIQLDGTMNRIIDD